MDEANDMSLDDRALTPPLGVDADLVAQPRGPKRLQALMTEILSGLLFHSVMRR